MNIDRDQILQLLHQQGSSDHVNAAQTQLPGQVDTDNPEHQNLLQKFGLNPSDLISKFTDGGEAGGLGGAIGKLL